MLCPKDQHEASHGDERRSRMIENFMKENNKVYSKNYSVKTEECFSPWSNPAIGKQKSLPRARIELTQSPEATRPPIAV